MDFTADGSSKPCSDTLTQDGITSAVAWAFTQYLLPGLVSAAAHPRLAAWSAAAEQLPAFAGLPQA